MSTSRKGLEDNEDLFEGNEGLFDLKAMNVLGAMKAYLEAMKAIKAMKARKALNF